MNTVRFFDLNMGSLPDELPVLILPDVFLMPEGKLSIKITDIKQITQVFWALSNGRMFAVFPKNGQDINRVGCAARICGFNENNDDSLTLSLVGVCRFHITEQFTKQNNNMLKVDFSSFAQDLNSLKIENEDALLKSLNAYLKSKHIDMDVSLLSKMSGWRLLAILIAVLPLDYMEKQAVFECSDFGDGIKILITILNMALAEIESNKGKQKC